MKVNTKNKEDAIAMATTNTAHMAKSWNVESSRFRYQFRYQTLTFLLMPMAEKWFVYYVAVLWRLLPYFCQSLYLQRLRGWWLVGSCHTLLVLTVINQVWPDFIYR
jgi:hypothetical protein